LQHKGCLEKLPKGTLIYTHIESVNHYAPVAKTSQSMAVKTASKIAGSFQRRFKSVKATKVANIMFFLGSEQVKIPLT